MPQAHNIGNDSGVVGATVKAALDNLAGTQLVFASTLATPLTSSVLVSGTAYWVYLGYVAKALSLATLKYYIATTGAGAQAAEFALTSAPSPPNGAAQSLTKIFGVAIAANLTVATAIQSQAFAQAIPAGTFLYGGIRTAMAVTQPTFNCLIGDFADGRILSTPASGVLTGAGPWSGGLVVGGPASQAPKIVVF
jgi:hypothetical protein